MPVLPKLGETCPCSPAEKGQMVTLIIVLVSLPLSSVVTSVSGYIFHVMGARSGWFKYRNHVSQRIWLSGLFFEGVVENFTEGFNN